MFDEPETLDNDNSAIPTPKLGMGWPASQLQDSSPPRMPPSFCSEDNKTEKASKPHEQAATEDVRL
uniref:Prolactin receptor n=1 Tax=Romanomermis culicivorax TaxID=13658 RepID=A0A915K9L2_ROMCU